MVQKWSKNGPKMVQKWSKNGPKMVQKWSKNGPKWSKNEVFYIKIVFDAQIKTLDLPLLIGYRVWLFKALLMHTKKAKSSHETIFRKRNASQKVAFGLCFNAQKFKG